MGDQSKAIPNFLWPDEVDSDVEKENCWKPSWNAATRERSRGMPF